MIVVVNDEVWSSRLHELPVPDMVRERGRIVCRFLRRLRDLPRRSHLRLFLFSKKEH